MYLRVLLLRISGYYCYVFPGTALFLINQMHTFDHYHGHYHHYFRYYCYN